MAYADQVGWAKVDPQHPRALACCDSCGFWWNRVDLRAQMEWFGDVLADTGYRYCYRCLYKPQPQLRPVILPEDPVPIVDPRPEYFVQNQNLNGFTQNVGPQTNPANTAAALGQGILTELDPTNPLLTAAAVLASSQTGWGLPQPATLSNVSGTITTSGVAQLLVPSNAAREYLLIYSPSSVPLAVAQGQPLWGSSATVIVGTGQGLLQNGLTVPAGAVWTGAVYIQSFIAKTPYFAFWG